MFNFKYCEVCNMLMPFIHYEDQYYCKICGYSHKTFYNEVGEKTKERMQIQELPL